jgi:membrane-associated phospholipid phosphatase
MPHNLVPSLHVVFSALILFSIIQTSKMPIARIALWGWLLLLCVSTLLVHQHHLLDVAAGLTLAMLFDHLIGHGENHV